MNRLSTLSEIGLTAFRKTELGVLVGYLEVAAAGEVVAERHSFVI